MKTVVVAVVVLTLASEGFGEGVQCVSGCLGPDTSDRSGVHSTFQKGIERAAGSEDDACTAFKKILTCVERCPAVGYATLAQEASRTWEKYCSADEATKQKFLDDVQAFQMAWTAAREKCHQETTTPDAACMLASVCIFGSALTSAKKDFSDDVVGFYVTWYKVVHATTIEETYGEALPSSCYFIFVPYQPEPPYPYEPYPYEFYTYDHYQREPYQRNPYQRNSYRRNPY